MARHSAADGVVRIRGSKDTLRAWQDCRRLAALIARKRGEKRSRPCTWSNPALARRAFVRFRHALVVQAMKAGASWEEIQAVLPKNASRVEAQHVLQTPPAADVYQPESSEEQTASKGRGRIAWHKPLRFRPDVD